MTSDLCTDDVVVRITTPQIISSETLVAAGGGGGGGGAGAGGRVAASSAAVELGRRLLLAARAGDTAAVLALMAEGAPFSTDWLGTSPLHLAAGGGHVDTCAVLLRAGVSRDARTKVERTPLHLAACGGHARAAALLLEAGAAVDCRDMLRMTPLHWAVQRGHAATAAALLAAGAEPLALSKFGKSPRALAAAARRDDLLRLLDDAQRQREAARSVQHLTEQMEEAPSSEPQLQAFDAVQRIQDLKPTKIKQIDKGMKTDGKNECPQPQPAPPREGAAAQLLRKHGITLLPTDDTSTVLNALQSGRTVVLSDAGKLMLKESEGAAGASKPPPPAPAAAANKSMVLTATPVRSPPRAGVKVFTLNNKLLAMAKDARVPVKRIINPQDIQHVKFVQLPADAKLAGGARRVTSRGGGAPAVKIIMNKSNFHRLMAGAGRAASATSADHEGGEGAAPAAGGGAEGSAGLRAQLAAAQRTLASLRAELRAARAKLDHYEQRDLAP